ncbi:helix-turn-helix transcriptional regulator [Neotabrizicola shimadae]|uniref:Autoinducer binding domain-containing protein n=1 Tax=Neotabrizicola shimadae TaxID=2807096 RepID=A0A8G0ZR20_9RHOB|nr:autoinducer binding domain-containing protein [Neotabrizicola shimadae]QYZ68839.1 autoinducer binding domain-containing protein [Neotabrizicola shimadae]
MPEVDTSTLPIHSIAGVAISGFYVALRVGFAFPLEEHNLLPEAWVRYYTQNGLMLHDPVMRWVYANTGVVRWSEIEIPDPANVMLRAKEHNLVYGLAVSYSDADNTGQRSFGSFCRPDREFTSEESVFLAKAVQEGHDDMSPPRTITEAEIEALRYLNRGLRFKQIAFELDVSEAAIKARLKNAKIKLRAKTNSQALSKAVKFGLI